MFILSNLGIEELYIVELVCHTVDVTNIIIITVTEIGNLKKTKKQNNDNIIKIMTIAL